MVCCNIVSGRRACSSSALSATPGVAPHTEALEQLFHGCTIVLFRVNVRATAPAAEQGRRASDVHRRRSRGTSTRPRTRSPRRDAGFRWAPQPAPRGRRQAPVCLPELRLGDRRDLCPARHPEGRGAPKGDPPSSRRGLIRRGAGWVPVCRYCCPSAAPCSRRGRSAKRKASRAAHRHLKTHHRYPPAHAPTGPIFV